MRTAAFSTKPVWGLWTGAIALALALHMAALAAIWVHQRDDDDDDTVGAPAIEIGMELTAPRETQENLPPGPEADSSAAASAVSEQKAKVEDSDFPKATPTDSQDADRVVAPQATKAPADETPKVEDTKADASAEAIASEATAPPKLDVAKEAPRSAAPIQGSGENVRRIRATWQKELVAHLNRFKRYPQGGSGHPAEIVVAFTLDRLGHVLGAAVQRSSGAPDFDRAALAMLARADPVPPPPPLIADEGLTFALPVIFRNKPR